MIKRLTSPTNDIYTDSLEYRIPPKKDLVSFLQPEERQKRIVYENVQSYFLNFEKVHHADPATAKLCKEHVADVVDTHLVTVMNTFSDSHEVHAVFEEIETDASNVECALEALTEIRRQLMMELGKQEVNSPIERKFRCMLYFNSECLHRPICLLFKKEIYVGPVRNRNQNFPTFKFTGTTIFTTIGDLIDSYAFAFKKVKTTATLSEENFTGLDTYLTWGVYSPGRHS